MSDRMTPTFGSLFAGIGGFDLGFERAGFRCAWQVEIDPFCQRVLAKHWPHVRRWDDVRTFPQGDPEEWRVDVVCGGFPCQDISVAGRGAGIGGERSGLWSEMARVVRVVRPRIVVVENVAALLHRDLGRVLGDLAACGYDAEWDCIPASAVGAPHRRDRVFVVAHAVRRGGGWAVAKREGPSHGLQGDACGHGEAGQVADSVGHRLERLFQAGPEAGATLRGGGGWWATEPRVGRVVDGVPSRVDRLRGLGNAVVPQVAEWLARRVRQALEANP